MHQLWIKIIRFIFTAIVRVFTEIHYQNTISSVNLIQIFIRVRNATIVFSITGTTNADVLDTYAATVK